MEKFKRCSGCKENMILTEFHKQKTGQNGLCSICNSCKKEYQTDYQRKNKDKLKISRQNYYINNKETINKRNKKWKKENRERISIYEFNYRKNNPELRKKINKKYQRNNLGKCAAINAKRRAVKLQATPSWLTDDHWKEIKEIYQDAKDIQWLSEEPLVIDHIYPLQGKNSCGLHVPWNLQILTQKENCEKSNKLYLIDLNDTESSIDCGNRLDFKED